MDVGGLGAIEQFIAPLKRTKSMRGRFIMLFNVFCSINCCSVFPCQCMLSMWWMCVCGVIVHMHVCILLQLTLGWVCLVSRSSVKSMHQLISRPTNRSSEGNSSGLKTDVGPISVLCRFNMISMSGRYSNRHRTYIKTYCKIWAARYRLYVGSI